MTFDELVTLVRREIIVDEYDDAYTDADLLDVLWRANVETAAAFDLPRAIASVAVPAGATSVTPPSGCRVVHSVTIDGDDLRSVDVSYMLRVTPGASRPARYFNYDPRRTDALRIAPASLGGTAWIEYTRRLVRPPALGDAEAWDGLLPEFHPVVAYRAAAILYQMEERQEESQYWMGEYQNRSSELAAFLGRTDVANLIVEPQRRNDEGAAG